MSPVSILGVRNQVSRLRGKPPNEYHRFLNDVGQHFYRTKPTAVLLECIPETEEALNNLFNYVDQEGGGKPKLIDSLKEAVSLAGAIHYQLQSHLEYGTRLNVDFFKDLRELGKIMVVCSKLC